MLKENDWNSNYEFGKYHIILPEGTIPITRHYISEQSILSQDEYHFVELPVKHMDFIELYNGYFYMIEKGVIAEMWMPSDNIY